MSSSPMGILSSATSPTTMAYISDSTSEKERGSGMGILGAAVGLGTIFGPGLGGLLGEGSYAIPFFIAGGMSLVGLLLIALFLPESLGTGSYRLKRISQERLTGSRSSDERSDSGQPGSMEDLQAKADPAQEGELHYSVGECFHLGDLRRAFSKPRWVSCS